MPSTLSKLSCVYWGNFRRFLRSFGPCVSQSFLVATPPLQPGPVLGGRLCHSEWRGREGKWQPWSEVASRPLACGLACRWRFAWPAPCSCTVWISCQYLQMRGSHIKNMISGFFGRTMKAGYPRSTFSGIRRLLFGQDECSLVGHRVLCLSCSWLGGLLSDIYHPSGPVFLHFPCILHFHNLALGVAPEATPTWQLQGGHSVPLELYCRAPLLVFPGNWLLHYFLKHKYIY